MMAGMAPKDPMSLQVREIRMMGIISSRSSPDRGGGGGGRGIVNGSGEKKS